MTRERGAMDILEEAVNLLRGASLGTWVVYLAGSVPFLLALLFFLNDMTRSPFAFEHLGTASLVVALLYVWKSVWQAVFARKLYETLSTPRPRLPVLRLIAMQAALQPVGLVLALPFPWITAFFRNVGLFAALGVPDSVNVARRQAALWTRQNGGVLALMTLGGLMIFLNALIMIALLPQLARSFLGIEGDFARLGGRILNTATLAVAMALAWMVIDPLLYAVYVLRCFYGESIATGEDLRSALRKAIATAVMLVALTGVIPQRAAAQVDPVALKGSIDRVIHQREFTWRAPHAQGPEPQGKWVGWVRAVENFIEGVWTWVKEKVQDWLRPKPETEATGNVSPVTRRVLEGLIAVTVALIIGSLYFFLRRRPAAVEARAVPLAAAAVDLADESLTADQMPESSWLKLAEEWLAKGDSRLALRALYLAALNFLSQRGLVSIQKWKSTLDYRRELDRRARAHPEIGNLFGSNALIFERGWYGRHTVSREMVEAFAAGMARIRDHADQ
ncbi:MAG TPA: hypothetical protein VKR43_11010 [Bryobacteraceae bacterium]|nr:hypothetical protein [Bryobacteraceae bacterium]